jgi:hypothetical protein
MRKVGCVLNGHVFLGAREKGLMHTRGNDIELKKLADRASLIEKYFRLPEHRDDLLRGEPFPGHIHLPRSSKILTQGLDRCGEAGLVQMMLS